MKESKKLIKESFDLLVKKRWLKEIGKAVDRYNKSRDRLQTDTHVLAVLVKRYNEIYSKDPLSVKATKQASTTSKAKWQFWEGWIGNHDMRIEDATCSNCGYEHHTVRRTAYSVETPQDVLDKLGNFCPNCGKPMERNLYNES